MSNDFTVNCSFCEEFDGTRYLEYTGSKGYCNSKNMILYSLEQKCCIDFVGAIPKIEVLASD